MSPEQIVEATLFASQTPLTPEELARADESLSVERVMAALQSLRQRYDDEEHAFQVFQLADGYQILTRPEYAPYLERFDSIPRSPILSQAALETLAIIAYRQPLSRIEVEDIRGVGCSTVLRTLQDWELIRVVGRAEGLGRPHLYGTTRRFLEHFGFQSLADLPRPDDLPIALRAAKAEPEPREEGATGEVEAARHAGAVGEVEAARHAGAEGQAEPTGHEVAPGHGGVEAPGGEGGRSVD